MLGFAVVLVSCMESGWALQWAIDRPRGRLSATWATPNTTNLSCNPAPVSHRTSNQDQDLGPYLGPGTPWLWDEALTILLLGHSGSEYQKGKAHLCVGHSFLRGAGPRLWDKLP